MPMDAGKRRCMPALRMNKTINAVETWSVYEQRECCMYVRWCHWQADSKQRTAEGVQPRCQLMRVGGVVHQPRVKAFDINHRVLSLPLCRQDLVFKLRHGRSHILDFGTWLTVRAKYSLNKRIGSRAATLVHIELQQCRLLAIFTWE